MKAIEIFYAVQGLVIGYVVYVAIDCYKTLMDVRKKIARRKAGDWGRK